MAGGAAEAGRSVASKVTAILLVFSRGSTYSLTELARLTGLPVSTAHRLAGELTARRLLERTEDGAYRIGLPLRMIGAGSLAAPAVTAAAPRAGGADPAGPGLLARAADAVTDLATATECVVRLGILDAGRVAAATVRPGAAAPSALVRSRGPVHAGALGRVLLAFAPAAAQDEVLDALPEAAAARLRRALRSTRLTRMAVTGGEPAAVAMPVFGAGGAVLAALELTVAHSRSAGAARAALMVAAGSLSRELATDGYTDPGADFTRPRTAV